jgi:hypothetical protein
MEYYSNTNEWNTVTCDGNVDNNIKWDKVGMERQILNDFTHVESKNLSS